METIMQLKNVRKLYKMGPEKIVALDDITLDIYKGEVICLLGPSGSGKSTLLNMMAGLEKPTKGTIRFKKNIQIEKLSENELAVFRKLNVGFVFQSFNLISTLTALENVTLPLIFDNAPRNKRNKQGKDILKKVGLDKRYRHKPNQLSGGQQQRVSIARAFVNNPEIVFADEPTGNLDSKTSIEMMKLITEMVISNKRTLVIVTHDLEISKYGNRIVHIKDGNIEMIEVNENPKYLELLNMTAEQVNA